jgi:signal transduction histidine kinase
MKDQLNILLVDDDERICSSVHEALSSFTKLKFELTCHQSIFEIDQEPCLENYDLALFNSNYLRQYSDEVSKIIGRMETVFPILFLGEKESSNANYDLNLKPFIDKRMVNKSQAQYLDLSIRYALKTFELEKNLNIEKDKSDLKSRFVSMASHEFRTPLSSILSSASLIERYANMTDQEKRSKHVDRIKSSVNNLNYIINDFLSLEKIESGAIDFNPELVQFDQYVYTIIDEIIPFVQKNQQIYFIHDGLNELLLDKNLLRNVLLNLLTNAVKYSVTAKDITLKTIADQDQLNIKVIDQGIGIPKKDQKRMFGRFFRASNTGDIHGTGLGLTIVKRYIDKMGGSINFQSELNKGTTFEIILPLEQPDLTRIT